ncbi:PREDICTED: putative F-box protein At3g17265 [Camelina sativa]|uniref:F-box protein At3g17265 n=1 Tax=Camelina sativa TaxID=90675 RepID=A0ABM0XRK9_CAMSA|nr:PREDICTED: putative F-box protein At3g17265 [Camelina sativa]
MDTLIHSVNLHGIQNSFDPSIEVAVKLNKLKDSEQFKPILIHCEGLLLWTPNGGKLVVWNPCTGQTRWIKSNHRNLLLDRYVLGYVNNNNKSWDSYRILTFDYFYCCLKASPLKFDIYEFNSDSWRFLDDVYPNSFIHSDGVTLKGNAYWYALDEEDSLLKFILKFDFTTERFERLRLPLSFKSTSYVSVVLSVVRGGKLALLQQRVDDTDSLKMDIWVTKTKIDEAKDLLWSNFLVVDLGKVMLPDVMMVPYMSFLVD